MDTPTRILNLLRDNGVPERSIRRELATICGISVQAVGQWFDKSTKRISPEYLAKIAARYGKTADYLITGKEPAVDNSLVNAELDALFGQLFARQDEFTAEHYAALQILSERLWARAAARFQEKPKDTNK